MDKSEFMRLLLYSFLSCFILLASMSSCKESESKKRIRKAALEEKLSDTVIDSIMTFDSLTNTTNLLVKKRKLENIYITPEIPANIIRNDGKVASQFETTRKLSFFISKKINLPEDIATTKVKRSLLLRFYISKEGRMMGIKILNPNYNKLDTALLEVAYKLKHTYKWVPATHQGKPVNSQVIIPARY